jgi:hypothetical protein
MARMSLTDAYAELARMSTDANSPDVAAGVRQFFGTGDIAGVAPTARNAIARVLDAAGYGDQPVYFLAQARAAAAAAPRMGTREDRPQPGTSASGMGGPTTAPAPAPAAASAPGAATAAYAPAPAGDPFGPTAGGGGRDARVTSYGAPGYTATPAMPYPETQTGAGAPARQAAPAVPGATPLPGTGAPGGLNAYLAQSGSRGGREQALMQALGVGPSDHSLADEFYRSLSPVLETLYSLGALGGNQGSDITGLINQFGGMLTQPGDFWGGVGGQLDALTGAPGFQSAMGNMTPGVAQGYASDIAGLRAMAQGSPFATDAAKQAIADSMAQYQQANNAFLGGQRPANPGNLWTWLTGAEDPYAAFYR